MTTTKASQKESEAKLMADPLCGTYYPSIDQKGRMSFPNKLREILGPEFYLCIGHDDHYIAVYSPEEFEAYRSKLFSVPGKREATSEGSYFPAPISKRRINREEFLLPSS